MEPRKRRERKIESRNFHKRIAIFQLIADNNEEKKIRRDRNDGYKLVDSWLSFMGLKTWEHHGRKIDSGNFYKCIAIFQLIPGKRGKGISSN